MVFMKLLETLSQRYLDSFHFQVSKDLLTSQLTRHLVENTVSSRYAVSFLPSNQQRKTDFLNLVYTRLTSE